MELDKLYNGKEDRSMYHCCADATVHHDTTDALNLTAGI